MMAAVQFQLTCVFVTCGDKCLPIYPCPMIPMSAESFYECYTTSADPDQTAPMQMLWG